MGAATTDRAATARADELHDRVQRVVERYAFADGETFDTLARMLAVHQATYDPGYRRLCDARGVEPTSDAPSTLPAVPTEAFKLTRVATFAGDADQAVFRTSGTTMGGRGVHALRRLDTYRRSALRSAEVHLWPRRTAVLAIAPTPEQLPDSSLSCMLGWFVEAWGGRFLEPDQPAAAIDAIASLTEPTVICATAFAWVHLLDAGLAARLPPGSRAMQTGGFKGRSREISASELRGAMAQALGIAASDIVGEYGMTELSSQLYAEGGETLRYVAPPWVRVSAADPGTLGPLPPGSPGVLRIEDLANVESAWAVQTADMGVVHVDGSVEILGRALFAPPRGCSLAIEEMLDR